MLYTCKVSMAKCKYCGETISRLDKEVCPFCGGRKPLLDNEYQTEDMTKALDSLKEEDRPKAKSKIVAAILTFLLGIFGVNSYYLGRYKLGLIVLGISALSIGGVGTIFFFTFLHNVFAYLIPLFVMEALMIGVGISYLVRADVTDAHGEFLK